MSIVSLFRSKATSTAAAAVLSSVLAGCASAPFEPVPYAGRSEPQSCRAYRSELAQVNRRYEKGTSTIIGAVIGGALGRDTDRALAAGAGALGGAAYSDQQRKVRMTALYNQCQADMATLNAGVCQDNVRQTSSGRIVNGQRVGDSVGTVRENQTCHRIGTPFPTGGNMAHDLGGTQYMGNPAPSTSGQSCEPITMQNGGRALLCTDPRTGAQNVYNMN